MKHKIMVLGLVCFFVFVGCGNNDTPSSVARKFYTALQKNDTKALGQVATPETVQTMAMFGEKVQGMMQSYGKITNTTEQIDGDTAVVSVTFENGESGDLTLKKIDGKWKVVIDKG
jgi:uncharacterized lipoprotein NlpE involved in copper resistance